MQNLCLILRKETMKELILGYLDVILTAILVCILADKKNQLKSSPFILGLLYFIFWTFRFADYIR